MNILGSLLVVVGLCTLFLGLLIMIPKPNRATGKRMAKFSAGAVAIGIVLSTAGGNEKQRAEAEAAGWSNVSEMNDAKKAGVTDPKAWAASKEDARKAAQAERVRVAVLMQPPTDQAGVVEAVERSRTNFHEAKNDFQKGALRPSRSTAICRSMRSLQVSNWIGKVSSLTTNSEGKGVLGIEFADDMHATTWNNAMSDIMDETLIQPGTGMYSAMGLLEKGDTVRFSGTFFQDDTDCLAEQSLTIDGSMREPEFTFRFSDARKVLLK